ncbi:hypothetical protein VF08_36755 [Nostoc linckia z8]|uniref:Uncharacterized protein n=1 Tax=Nostoc linckia z8 TaxID=1628746 RepID=A0A9Q5Z4E9_NOSLI|nr:hypothetical protein VF08_36755 [Nostoc linckia z8]
MELVHRHAGGDRAERVDELAFDQLLQRFRVHGAQAERLGGGRDRLGVGADADVELGLHVDAQAIERDQRVAMLALHREADGVHVDRHRLVQDRQHQRAAVHHHLLAAKAGADEGDFLSRSLVEPRNHDADRQQRGERHQRVDEDGKGGSGQDFGHQSSLGRRGLS